MSEHTRNDEPAPESGTKQRPRTVRRGLAVVALLLGGAVIGSIATVTAGAWALLGKPLPSFPRSLPMWARASVVAALLLNWAYSIATGV